MVFQKVRKNRIACLPSGDLMERAKPLSLRTRSALTHSLGTALSSSVSPVTQGDLHLRADGAPPRPHRSPAAHAVCEPPNTDPPCIRDSCRILLHPTLSFIFKHWASPSSRRSPHRRKHSAWEGGCRSQVGSMCGAPTCPDIQDTLTS